MSQSCFLIAILTLALDFPPTVKTGWVMLSQETVVAEQFATLVVILLVNKSRIALVAAEALGVPVSFPIKHQVLHIDWQLARLAVLCDRLVLDIFAPDVE